MLSLTKLERYGYRMTYETLNDLVVHAEDGTEIVCERDTYLCDHMT